MVFLVECQRLAGILYEVICLLAWCFLSYRVMFDLKVDRQGEQ